MRYDPIEEASFLKAVRDDPEVTRVYADWLEEHGEGDNAEFIRVSLEYEKYRNTNPNLNQERETLDGRRRILSLGVNGWTGRQLRAVCLAAECPQPGSLVTCSTRGDLPRGLVTELDTHAAEWCGSRESTARALVQGYPLSCLKFTGQTSIRSLTRHDVDAFLPPLIRVAGGLGYDQWAAFYVFLGDRLEHSDVTRDQAALFMVPRTWRSSAPEAMSTSPEIQPYTLRLLPGRQAPCRFTRLRAGLVAAVTDGRDVFYRIGCCDCGGSCEPCSRRTALSGSPCRGCNRRLVITIDDASIG